jgi:dihydrofolate synthase/folylpolyglutamate synthase
MPVFTSMPDTLSGWLEYLERLHPKTIALGLDRVDKVRECMGLQLDFPVIAVAGTNGKGSTCAMLECILNEAGYRVGCYTSPHLLRYNERVRVACREADDAELCRAFVAVESARGDIPLTYFEYGTLAAVRHFIDSKVDVAVLEIGLGGRLDAVNVFDPDCAIITSIALDHMDYLGNSREAIGTEKAGVYRAHVSAICGDPDPPHTVSAHATLIGADFRQVGRDFGFVASDHGDEQSWNFWSGEAVLGKLPLPSLQGSFQRYNAACAIEALQSLSGCLPVRREHIEAGLQHVRLHGRFELQVGMPPVILDVAHNPHAALGLAENLRRDAGNGRTLAVFGMLADKDIAGVVRAVGASVDAWFIAGIPHIRSADVGTLAEVLRIELPQSPVECCQNVLEAYARACHCAGENDKIIVFGSFYTVADVLRVLPATQGNN